MPALNQLATLSANMACLKNKRYHDVGTATDFNKDSKSDTLDKPSLPPGKDGLNLLSNVKSWLQFTRMSLPVSQ